MVPEAVVVGAVKVPEKSVLAQAVPSTHHPVIPGISLQCRNTSLIDPTDSVCDIFILLNSSIIPLGD